MAVKKVTVNLPEEQVKFLQEIASKEDMSFTDVLRRAINLERFFVQQEEAGHKFLIEDKGQRLREVLRR